jgi:hypothetical protein
MTALPEPTELRAVAFLREEIQRTDLPVRPRGWLGIRRRGWIATVVSLLAAVPAALVILVGASSTAPTDSVSRHGDGGLTTVSLKLTTSVGVLNAQMKATRLAGRPVPAVPGCRGSGRTRAGGHGRRLLTLSVIPPPQRDRTQILALRESGGFSPVGKTVLGPVPACVGTAA